MNIRRAEISDMPRAAALHADSLATHFPYLPPLHSRAEIERWFATHVWSTRTTFLAEDADGSLLGYVSTTPGWVQHLYVARAAQRRGVGSALLAHVTADGAPRALWTFQRNEAGNRFYLTRGWRPVEHSDGAANDEREPDTRYAFPPARPSPLALRAPAPDTVPAFIAAMNAGWSPSSMSDVRADVRAKLRADEAGYLAELNGGPGRLTMADGSTADRLPGNVFWLWDGAFCGNINFRHVPGTEELPGHVSGHIGYSVVPWKWRRGVGTAALAAILPTARAAGLRRVSLTCDADNVGSWKVIEANGGVFAGPAPPNKKLFWIAL